MVKKKMYAPPKDFSNKAHVKSMKEYNKLYNLSVKNPSKF